MVLKKYYFEKQSKKGAYMKGSMQKRGNKWFLTVSLGFDTKGKRIRKTKTIEAKDEKEAAVKLNEFIQELEKGTSLDAHKLSLQEFLEIWLKDYAEKTLRKKTFICYQQFIQSRIVPALGHIKLQKLSPIHLVKFYNNLAEDGIREDKVTVNGKRVKKSGGLKDSTILKYHRVISSALQDAVEWQLILNNPCERLKPPKIERKKAKHYDEQTVRQLFKALESEPIKYRTIVMLAVVTGMRRGEIMALQWTDIDGNKIDINKAVYYVPGEQGIDEVKNYSSNRIVVIPQFMVELLKQYKAWQLQDKIKCAEFWQNNHGKSDFLFTNSTGKLMHVNTISSWFPEFLKRHDLPELTFHGLRHSAASILLDGGLNLKALSEILGHANGITTINLYTHKLKTADDKAVEIMEQTFGIKDTLAKVMK